MAFAERFDLNAYVIGGKLDKTGATHHSNDFNRWYAMNKEDALLALRRTVVSGMTLQPPSYNVLSEHAGDCSRLFLDVDVSHGGDDDTVFGLHRIGMIIERFLSELKKSSFLKILRTREELKPWICESSTSSDIGLWNVFPDWFKATPSLHDPFAAIITARPCSSDPDECRFNFHIVFPFLFIQRCKYNKAISEICNRIKAYHSDKLDSEPIQKGGLRSVYQGKNHADKLVYDLYGGFINGRVYMKHEEVFCRHFDLPNSIGRLYGKERPPTEYTDTEGERESNRLALHHYLDHAMWIAPAEIYAKVWSMTSILPDYKGNAVGKPSSGFDTGSNKPGAPPTAPLLTSQSLDDEDSQCYHSPVAGADGDDESSEDDGDADLTSDPNYITPFDGVIELYNTPNYDDEKVSLQIRDRLAKHFMCSSVDVYSPAVLMRLMQHAMENSRGSVSQIASDVARIATLYIDRFAAIVFLSGGNLPIYVRMPSSKGKRCSYTVMLEKSYLQMFDLDDSVTVTDGKLKEKVNGAKAWLHSRFRLSFDAVGMYVKHPKGVRPLSVLNLWKGIRFTKEMCEPYKNFKMIGPRTGKEFSNETTLYHIFKWLCHGDTELYSYAIRWCAHLLQRPLEKTQATLLFSSEEGTGKGIFTSMLCHLIGDDHSLTISNSKDMFGDFAGHLATLILVVFDEVSYLNAAQRCQLKALITDKKMRVEKKGVDTRFATSYLNLIMNTNLNVKDGKGALMDISPQERRTVMFPCDSAVNSPHSADYFHDWVSFLMLSSPTGGSGALSFGYFLYNLDLSDWIPTPIPITKLAVESKMASANMPHQFWYSVLVNGAFKWDLPVDSLNRMPIEDKKGQVFSRSEIYSCFKDWCHDQHYGRVPADQVFWSAIECVCSFTTGRNMFDGKRVRTAILPSLQDMRARYASFYRGLTFEADQDENGKVNPQTVLDKFVAPVIELYGKSPAIARGRSTGSFSEHGSAATSAAGSPSIQPVCDDADKSTQPAVAMSPVLPMDEDPAPLPLPPPPPLHPVPTAPVLIQPLHPFTLTFDESDDEEGSKGWFPSNIK